MKKRISALLLVIAALAAALTGCGGPSGKKRPENNSNGNAYGTEEEKEIKEYVVNLSEDAGYEGETFTYMGGWADNFPTKEEETADIRSNALFYRQRDIEDLYGVKWVNHHVEGSDVCKDTVINEVMAGGDTFDLVNGFVRSVGRPTLNAGVLMEMQDLPHVDLDREWWNQHMWDSYALDGKLYFLLGPINIYNYLDTCVVMFNKNVTATYGISDADLYNSVLDGTWTIDKMFEVASAVPENKSGNGAYRYVEPDGMAFLYGSGYRITLFDEEGTPYVPEKLPREFSDLADKITPVFTDKTQSVFADPNKSENVEKKYGMSSEEIFDNDQGLFLYSTSGWVESMRELDVVFGILPIPKLTESQPDYYSATSSWSVGAVYTPKTVRNPEMTGRITESMGALSQIYVREAYYEKLLKGQSIFDLESADMLDIIFSTKVYDMADLYCDGDLNTLGPFIAAIGRALTYDNSNFASAFFANAKIANLNIMILLRTLDEH